MQLFILSLFALKCTAVWWMANQRITKQYFVRQFETTIAIVFLYGLSILAIEFFTTLGIPVKGLFKALLGFVVIDLVFILFGSFLKDVFVSLIEIIDPGSAHRDYDLNTKYAGYFVFVFQLWFTLVWSFNLSTLIAE
jgi:hypothetical protein